MTEENSNKELTGKQLLKSIIWALQYMDTNYNFASGAYFSDQEAKILTSIISESTNNEIEALKRAQEEHALDLNSGDPKKKLIARSVKTKNSSATKKVKSKKKSKTKIKV